MLVDSNITTVPVIQRVNDYALIEQTEKSQKFQNILKRVVFQFKIKAVKRKIKPKKTLYFKRISNIFIVGRTPEYNRNAMQNRVFQNNALKCGIIEIKQ